MPIVKRNGLTARQVETLPPGTYCDGNNLYLQVRPNSRSWIFRYQDRDTKQQRHMGLGPTRDVTLAEARDKAWELRRQMRSGVDPIDQKRERLAARVVVKPKAQSFELCTRAYVTDRLQSTTARYRMQTIRQLEKHAFPQLRTMPIDEIAIEHVVKVLRPIWVSTNPTAMRVRAAMASVFGYAKAHGWRADNPAEWTDLLENILPDPAKVHQVENFKAMPVEDMPPFMATLRGYFGVKYRATEFHALTAARPHMTRGATWNEIDHKGRAWTIPADRMKMRRPFRVPLTDRMLVILDEAASLRQNEYLFPGAWAPSINDHAIALVVKELSGDRKQTAHGTRATFCTWAGERTNFDREVREIAMGHKFYSDSESPYVRDDLLEKRRVLMQAWDDYCSGG